MDAASFALNCPLLTAGGAAVAAVLRLLVRHLRGDRGREACMLRSWLVSRRRCLGLVGQDVGRHGRVLPGDDRRRSLLGGDAGGLLLGDAGGLLRDDAGRLLLGDAGRLLLDADRRLILGGHGRHGRLFR